MYNGCVLTVMSASGEFLARWNDYPASTREEFIVFRMRWTAKMPINRDFQYFLPFCFSDIKLESPCKIEVQFLEKVRYYSILIEQCRKRYFHIARTQLSCIEKPLLYLDILTRTEYRYLIVRKPPAGNVKVKMVHRIANAIDYARARKGSHFSTCEKMRCETEPYEN